MVAGDGCIYLASIGSEGNDDEQVQTTDNSKDAPLVQTRSAQIAICHTCRIDGMGDLAVHDPATAAPGRARGWRAFRRDPRRL